MGTYQASPSDLHIEALTPERRDELLTFLGEDGFVDNPDWADCYCQWPFEEPGEGEGGDDDIPEGFDVGAYNRALACKRIDERTMRGFLALREGRIIGWCAAGPRERYTQLGEILHDGTPSVGSVMCFVVAPEVRNQGIGPALLDAAIEGFRAEGLKIAEAYPRRDAESESMKFHGSLGMYLAAGFAIHGERQDGTTVVRLPLVAARATHANM
jgi:ribosomal protein S18 acetylase RimI-like enzyme